MTDEKLAEIEEEYRTGYEKAYKNLPDLIAEVRALRAALADAVNALECAPDRNKPMWQAIRTGRAALEIK